MTQAAHTSQPGSGFVPGPVLLLGAPGVGKGTQAKILMDRFGIPQISTGDLLRGNVAKGTDLGKLAKTLMDGGQLVPDDIVNGMVAERLVEPDTAPGYVLDGFPRTLVQADWLDLELAEHTHSLPLVAVAMRVDYNQLLRRITGRRSCPVCGRIYNIYTHAPKFAGHCDVDGTPLHHRSDDTEEAFIQRMVAYEAKTAGVIDHYRALGRFEEVDGEGPVADVTTGIVAALKRLRAK